MAAYVIVDEEITDPQRFDEYRRLAGATLAAHGASFLVRGGNPETLEGDWRPKRMVVIQFESAEQARAWYHSPEYQAAVAARQGAAVLKFVLAEGV